jgi:hypothetical protein
MLHARIDKITENVVFAHVRQAQHYQEAVPGTMGHSTPSSVRTSQANRQDSSAANLAVVESRQLLW